MSLFTDLRNDVNGILSYGLPVRLKHYVNGPDNDGFDDSQSIVSSGVDVWTSGLVFPMKNKWGSTESLLLEQGKLKMSDKNLFIVGNIETTDTMKIGIGSPTVTEHSLVPNGVQSYPPAGDITYKKLYIRELPTGSLVGEQ